MFRSVSYRDIIEEVNAVVSMKDKLTADMGTARPCRYATLVIFLLLMPWDQGYAQSRPVELGIDGAISYSFVDDNDGQGSDDVQTWAFPLQRFRAAFFLTTALQAQATTGFEVADYGEVSTVRFALALAALYHLTGDRTRSGLYVSGGAGLNLLSDVESDTQWSLGTGLGFKFPLGHRLSLRPALEVSRSLETDRRSAATTVSAVIGLSFFTK